MKIDDKIKKTPKGNPGLGILSSLGDEDTNKEYKKVDIYKIDFNKKNLYSEFDTEEDIIELAEDIAENGLIHDIVVKREINGKYLLVSGERRTRAYRYLYENTKDEKWKHIRARVSEDYDDELDEELALLKANRGVRVRNDLMIAKEVERIEAIYKAKRARGERIGVLRQRVADETGMSEAQVKRYKQLNKLIPEFQKMLDSGEASFSTVLYFSVFSEDIQKKIHASLIESGQIVSMENAIRIKEEVLSALDKTETGGIETSKVNQRDVDSNVGGGKEENEETKEIASFIDLKDTGNSDNNKAANSSTPENLSEQTNKKDRAEGKTIEDTIRNVVQKPISIKKKLEVFIKFAQNVVESEDIKHSISDEERQLIEKVKQLVDCMCQY